MNCTQGTPSINLRVVWRTIPEATGFGGNSNLMHVCEKGRGHPLAH